MHYRTADTEVFVELILRVKAEQSLALEREKRLVFQRDTDICARVDDTLVGDGHDSHGVVDGIIGVLRKHDTAGHHNHRPSRHIHCVETDRGTSRCLILSDKRILVFVGKLLGHDECRVIQLTIDILRRDRRISDLTCKMLSERLGDGENDLTVGRLHSVAFDIVEEAVGIGFLVGVYPVEIHDLKQRLVIDLHTGGVAEELDVHLEVLALELVCAERIDVLHHQTPHRQFGRHGGGTEHFQIERLGCCGDI